jgi:hypothetical protein
VVPFLFIGEIASWGRTPDPVIYQKLTNQEKSGRLLKLSSVCKVA